MRTYSIVESEDGKYFAKVITDGGDDSIFLPKKENLKLEVPLDDMKSVIKNAIDKSNTDMEYFTEIINGVYRLGKEEHEKHKTSKVKWGASYGEIMSFRFEGICECGQEVDHLWDYCPSCGMKLE